MIEGEIVRSAVLQSDIEEFDAPSTEFHRMAILYGVVLIAALTLFIGFFSRFEVISDYGVPVVLQETPCLIQNAARGRRCFKLSARQLLALRQGEYIAIRALSSAATDNSTLNRYLVIDTNPYLIQTEQPSKIAITFNGRLHGSLIRGQMKSSPVLVLLDGWRRLIGQPTKDRQ